MQVNFTTLILDNITAACMFEASPRGAMLVASTTGGALQMYSLPDLTLEYQASDIALGANLLMDVSAVTAGSADIQDVADPPFILDITAHRIPAVCEEQSESAASRGKDPRIFLIAITSLGDLLVYKSFWYREAAGDALTAGLRFSRQMHDAMLRGAEIWDDMFVDEMEFGDHTRFVHCPCLLVLGHFPPLVPYHQTRLKFNMTTYSKRSSAAPGHCDNCMWIVFAQCGRYVSKVDM